MEIVYSVLHTQGRSLHFSVAETIFSETLRTLGASLLLGVDLVLFLMELFHHLGNLIKKKDLFFNCLQIKSMHIGMLQTQIRKKEVII